MIHPATQPTPADVARHYDELDPFYREIWGEHVHHGAWFPWNDPGNVEEATRRLLYLAARPLRLLPGSRLIDIGCGYGASARWLAESFGAEVTALTLSGRQVNAARSAPLPDRGHVRYELADWLENDLPDATFDAALAIESLAHMPDKAAFFRQLHRTLKPGGRAAIACWTAAPDPGPLDAALLRQVCADGRLPGIGTIDNYLALASGAELVPTAHRDLTREVEPTWRIITRRAIRNSLTRPHYLRFLLGRILRKRTFLLTLPRVRLAYRTGALQYSLLWLKK